MQHTETKKAKFKLFDLKKDLEMVYTVSLAVIMALVFRSFAYEPFHIPSGSMKNTLLIGDYIWVSKYSYGYSRFSFPFGLPLFEGRLLEKTPERGDVVVFRPALRPKTDFIKRLVGLPGDRIQVKDGVLYINNEPVPKEYVDDVTDVEDGRSRMMKRYKETLPNGVSYYVLDDIPDNVVDNTQLYIVPSGHYFMMGDNRDHSVDSRFINEIGFVPNENLIGHAASIFISADQSARLWQIWKWPAALRYDRFLTAIK